MFLSIFNLHRLFHKHPDSPLSFPPCPTIKLLKIPTLTLLFAPTSYSCQRHSHLPPSVPFFSFLRVLSVSHSVLAKLVAKLLDEQSQLSGGLRLLLQELITEAGNVLLDLLQLTYNAVTHRHINQVM